MVLGDLLALSGECISLKREIEGSRRLGESDALGEGRARPSEIGSPKRDFASELL
ncbi:hypothetical protein DEO72_LG1g3269 [Vigna unguiculata]|uniref:Uncharacterized protein n=1 Tax=Vigna unguiculata TaxID=3917 RepID=A0A4D6KSU0_VIGUN|nr:hypothetical protein DEO72_LG1g3269 [Vigna unguiculata]